MTRGLQMENLRTFFNVRQWPNRPIVDAYHSAEQLGIDALPWLIYTTVVVLYYRMLNIFKSKLREKLLVYYFSSTDAEHYIRELSKILEVDATNLSRELAGLERQGFFVSQKRGQQKYFWLNKKHPLFKEIKDIISKTAGIAGSLKNTFGESPGLKFALLYGSFAKSEEDSFSDIDILLVGDIGFEEIGEMVSDLERKFQREINFKIYSLKEFLKKRNKDAFLRNILREKHVVLIDKLKNEKNPQN